MIEAATPDVDGEFWTHFERRLAELPLTADDAVARADLVTAARMQLRCPPAGVAIAEEYAEVAHRLRYGLGPTVEEGTLRLAYGVLDREARALLEAGVSPELLGLVGGGGGVR